MNYDKVKVLGNDKQIHEVADFIAAGKTHEDAIGIVFGTPIIGLRVLAFDSWEGAWGCTNRVLTETRSESQALQILCGLDDTKRIAKEQSDLGRMTAAKWCWNYQKGGFQWYLPSVMELAALFLVRDQANEAMTQLGCDNDCLLAADDSCGYCYWSSSEVGSNNAWDVNFDSGSIGYCGKDYGSTDDSFTARSVAVLSDPYIAIEEDLEESRKDDRKDKKLMWELLPLEDVEDIAAVYTAGAKKYGKDRWQNLPDGYNRYKAAMLRHLLEHEKGNWTDSDTGCIHLAQVAWNAIAMLHIEKQKRRGDD